MPLCPQITNTPITVVLNADFTVTDVVPVLPANTEQLAEVETLIDGKAEIYYQTTAPVGAGINENDLWYDTDDGNKPYVFRSGVWVSVQDGSIATAQSAANTALTNAAAANAVGVAAQGTANTALANAATAFTAAQNSLQPSANTIVNASNQMTAINGTGITVFSGASATSGARVVLNSVGLAGFNSGGVATFSVSASTGAAVFAGDVTGATITGSSLNIAGKFIVNGSTGIMQTTDAVLQGTLTSSNVTITGGTLTIGTKFSVNNIGVLTASDGIFTGKITSTDATITGGSLTVGATFSVTSAGVLTASSGTIGGTTLGVSSLTGGTIQTSSGSSAVILNGASNAVQFKNSGTIVANLVPLGSGGLLIHAGATPDPSGGTFPQMFVASTNLSMFASATLGIGIATGTGISVNGTTSLNSQTNYPGVATGSGTAMVVVTTGSRVAIVTSSERFKEQIKYINTTGWLDKVMQMKPITYKTSEDFTTPGEPNETQIGFLAEDIYDIGGDLEKAVVLDPLGEPFSLSYDRLTVFLTLAIKELKAEIDTLKGA